MMGCRLGGCCGRPWAPIPSCQRVIECFTETARLVSQGANWARLRASLAPPPPVRLVSPPPPPPPGRGTRVNGVAFSV